MDWLKHAKMPHWANPVSKMDKWLDDGCSDWNMLPYLWSSLVNLVALASLIFADGNASKTTTQGLPMRMFMQLPRALKKMPATAVAVLFSVAEISQLAGKVPGLAGRPTYYNWRPAVSKGWGPTSDMKLRHICIILNACTTGKSSSRWVFKKPHSVKFRNAMTTHDVQFGSGYGQTHIPIWFDMFANTQGGVGSNDPHPEELHVQDFAREELCPLPLLSITLGLRRC